MKTDIAQMAEDLARGETRQVEFKEWMDISKGPAQTKIARSIVALSNSGGGRLYFGVDDNGVALEPSTDFALSCFSQEVIHTLLKKHVGELECQVRNTEYLGGQYPVVHVPRHGEVPWVAPDVHGSLNVYIRSIRPETVSPTTRDHWDELLGSIMEVREQRTIRRLEDGIVARTQEIAHLVATELKDRLNLEQSRVPKPDWELMTTLAEDVRVDFARQLGEIKFEGDPATYREELRLVGEMASNNVVEGYGLLDDDDNLVPIDDLHGVLKNANTVMHSVSFNGWSDFLTLTDPRVSPKSRYWDIAGHQVTGVEGMHHRQRAVIGQSLDYWRAYAAGVFATCKSFDEDAAKSPNKFLTTNMMMLRMHSILVHAATVSRSVTEVTRIGVFSRPTGILGRVLKTGVRGDFYTLGSGIASDIFPFKDILSKEDLERDYVATLAKTLNKLARPFADRVSEDYFSRQRVETMFTDLRARGVAVQPLPPALA